MCRKSLSRLVAAVVSVLTSIWAASAQTDGTYVGYSPYSVYGIGNLHPGGTAWNRGMAGVGIATRNKRFVNITNPASVTARDTLSFMSDFGISGKTSLYSEGNIHGLNTTFNLDDFVISFPMWNHTAMYAGITPFSEVGYKISYTESDVYSVSRTFTSQGNGGLYQVFTGAAVTLWDRLSLGVQGNFLFGSINKSASSVNGDSSYLDFNTGDSLQVNNLGVKFGLQYEQKLSTKNVLTLGATYRLSTRMNGHRIHYTENGSNQRNREENVIGNDNLWICDELGLGLSFRKADVWMAEFNYIRSGWASSGMESVPGFSNNGQSAFASSVGESFRGGFEITPNRNDIRYFYKRCTYRAGAYYEKSYYTVDGAHVNSIGITLGMTIPVYRWYNGLSFSVDLGKRGLSSTQISENYIGFNLGLNMFDIWFKKPKYE